MPQEGQIEPGPNGERAVFSGGHWVMSADPAAPVRAPGSIGGVGIFIPKAPKVKEAPAGYRFRADGGMEIIPGGPADPEVKGDKPSPGYRWSDSGHTKQEAIPGGPADPTGGEMAAPGDVSKTGTEYLSSLPKALANQVVAYATGRLTLPQGASLRSPQVRQLQAALLQYDPEADAAKTAARFALRKSMAAGPEGKQLTALNAALGHLGQLESQISGTAGHSIPFIGRAVNAGINSYESNSGDPGITNYRDTQGKLAGELSKFYKGGTPGEADTQRYIDQLSENASTEQKQSGIANAAQLLTSPLDEMFQRYAAVMGPNFTMNDMLDDHTKAVLLKVAPAYAQTNGLVPGHHTPYSLLAADSTSGGGGSGTAGPPVMEPQGSPPPTPFDAPSANIVTAASGATRQERNPQVEAGMDMLIRRGRPVEEAAAFAAANKVDFTPEQYQAAVAYQKANLNYRGGYSQSTKTMDNSLIQQAAGSAGGAYASGAANALTMGLTDEAAGAIGAVGGGDYTQSRDAFNAKKNILAEAHPLANIAGNITGGVMGMAGGGALAARAIPGALGAASAQLGEFAPMAGDAAYGAAYGAGENNQNRIGGAVGGAFLGAAGGAAGRGATRGLANIIAPPAGEFAPAYAQGVFPTIGQRFGRSGIAGRAINTAEQALQSFPGLGSLVSRARQIPRDVFQKGGFNDALGEIAQQLPPDIGPGTDAHTYASQAFGHAYDTARSGMQFAPDGQYIADLNGFIQQLGNGMLNEQQASQVGKVIQNSVGTRLPRGGGVLNGDAYKAAGTELGDVINVWGRDGTTAPMADALRNYNTIFDNAARRNSNPQAVQMLDQADAGYAKLVRLQNASARGGVGKEDGTFSPNNLTAAVKQEGGGVRSSAFNRGDALMQDYANAGRGLSDTLANSGTAERLYTGQAVAGVGGTSLGAPAAVAAHPGALAPFALYAPGINKLVTRAIAPREAVLSPNLANTINALGAQIYNRAGAVGRVAAPGALGWKMGQ